MLDLLSYWAKYLFDPLNIILLIFLVATLLSRSKVSRTLGCLGVSLLLFLSLPYFSQVLFHSLEREYPQTLIEDLPKVNQVFVLGGGLKLPQGSWHEAELGSEGQRLNMAVKLFRAGKVKEINLLGGNKLGLIDYKTGPEYAKNILVSWGIPASAIHVSSGPINTEQELEIISGLSNRPSSTVDGASAKAFIVSSAFHLRRVNSLACAKKMKDFILVPATHYTAGWPAIGGTVWVPNSGDLKNSNLAIREYLRMFSYALTKKISVKAIWSNYCH